VSCPLYTTAHLIYVAGLASRNDKASVPWVAIALDQDKYVHYAYLPDGFLLVDPSKLTSITAPALARHWADRIERDEDAFGFHDMVPRPEKLRKQRPKTSRKPKKVLVIYSSDTDQDISAPASEREVDELLGDPPIPPQDKNHLVTIDDGQERRPVPRPKPMNRPSTNHTISSINILPPHSIRIGTRIHYLKTLSKSIEYQELVAAIALMPEGFMIESDKKQLLPWTNWRYTEIHLPEDLHINRKWYAFTQWINTRPFRLENKELVGRYTAECITLVTGIALRDIQRPDVKSNDGTIYEYPDYVCNTNIPRTQDVRLLLPFCRGFHHAVQRFLETLPVPGPSGRRETPSDEDDGASKYRPTPPQTPACTPSPSHSPTSSHRSSSASLPPNPIVQQKPKQALRKPKAVPSPSIIRTRAQRQMDDDLAGAEKGKKRAADGDVTIPRKRKLTVEPPPATGRGGRKQVAPRSRRW
jgi:hypothetical protein